MNDSTRQPIEVRAPAGGRQMEIDWGDGHLSLYPHRILRGFCPCAACQGYEGPIRFRPPGDLDLVNVEEVGSYALLLQWGDGHGSGIYTFAFLRSLCCCESCSPGDPSSKTFARG